VGAVCAAGLATVLFTVAAPAPRIANATGDTRTLTLHHIHTREDITITFKRNGKYDDAALKTLDRFVRDWRKDEEVRMDPRLYDMMWEVQQEVGYKGPIHIVCGYRAPSTNAMLRSRSGGVARTSLHMAGKAMDFSMPGADVAAVRAAALRVQGGGVGYYPSSGIAFVHMDVGNVRHWPRMTRDQLAKVFPDGRTLHIPSDGNPMPGYQLALADAERGSTDRLAQTKTRNLFAALLGGAEDVEEVGDKASVRQNVTQRRAVASLTPAITTNEAAPVPLPQSRPMFQIASTESRPVPAPTRHMNVAALTPNQIIGLRGYWQGPQDAAVVVDSPTRALRVSDEPDVTASLGTASLTDRVPPEIALAFASRIDPSPTELLATHLPGAPAVVTRQGTASIAVKPPAEQVRAVNAGDRLDDPWIRGVMLAPRMQTAMTVTTFGAPDFAGLQPFLQKPASSVMMTFSVDPYLGMGTDRFGGSAIVFQATVTHGMRTASLAR
jgi:uncharacterized protein YcbK (DUF882 family)